MLHTTGMQQHCPSSSTTSCNCGISTDFSKPAPEESAGPAHRDVENLVTTSACETRTTCSPCTTTGKNCTTRKQGHRPPHARQLGNLDGLTNSLDHGKASTPRRSVDDHVDELQLRKAPVVAHNGQRLGRTCTTCIPGTSITSLKNCTWGIHGRKDHGDVTLRHDGNVDELDVLRLRKIHSFTAV